MHRQIGLFIILAAILGTNKVVAHSMVPTYPIWKPSHVDGVVTTQLELFNKRQDVEWYEIAVFDKNWRTVPFVTSYHILRLEYLARAKFDIYINQRDIGRAEYVCSRSKVMGEGSVPVISSRVCSKFKL
jgi:hypothetical protein